MSPFFPERYLSQFHMARRETFSTSFCHQLPYKKTTSKYSSRNKIGINLPSTLSFFSFGIRASEKEKIKYLLKTEAGQKRFVRDFLDGCARVNSFQIICHREVSLLLPWGSHMSGLFRQINTEQESRHCPGIRTELKLLCLSQV